MENNVRYGCADCRAKACLTGEPISTQAIFDDAILWRSRLTRFLDDVFGEARQDPDIQFFKDAFKAQELQVRLMKIAASLATGEPFDPKEFEPVLEETKKTIEEGKDFGRLEMRYEDIQGHLKATETE